MAKTVLAIDPGTAKCGFALVHRDDASKISLIWHAVLPRDQILEALRQANEAGECELIIVGSGTSSGPLVAEIRAAHPSVGILVVDEKDTTLQARERYWEHNSRFGWRKFIPSTLQVPPKPYDDFVALILAERVLAP